MTKLQQMLRYRRPARSNTEEEFISKYIDTIPDVYQDQYGNRIRPGNGSRVIISCHTDTVHTMPGLQQIKTSKDGLVSLHKRERVSNCLGADDTAGVYAAIRMIEAGLRATFIFHRDEEIGGKGSSWLARNYPEWLEEYDICLALDRRGTSDIITSQFFQRTASREFADSLADELDMGHSDAEGIFTDSANYSDLIPECSNLSVGYQNEHTRSETLDTAYLERVIERLIKVDWDKLTVARDPQDDILNDYRYDDGNNWWDDLTEAEKDAILNS